jgi:peptide deformylase
MIRDILIHPDPRLKKPCDRVQEVTAEIHVLAKDMLDTMYDAPGIGLAAPQVGAMLNPIVFWASEDLSVYDEGCLSIPDQYAEVSRPGSVKVRWMGLDAQTYEQQFDGLWATCVQHEIDHLNGKLFIDYLGPLKRQMITRRMEKLKRERARFGDGR